MSDIKMSEVFGEDVNNCNNYFFTKGKKKNKAIRIAVKYHDLLVAEVNGYKVQNEGLWDALARKEIQAEKVIPLEKQLERMIEVAEELNYRLAKTEQPEGFYGDIERSKELLGEHNATN